MNRRGRAAATTLVVLAAAVLTALGVDEARNAPAPGAAALRAGVRRLLAMQSEDGGFRSETYGLLRTGQSLTPFVLVTLLELPPGAADVPAAAIDRGLAFIARHVDESGALGRKWGAAEDYPNYATALAVRAMALARREGWREAIAPLVAELRRQQFAEDRGWTRDDPAYGGFGIGGPLREAPHAGHVDLSMTRIVLEALRDAGVDASDPVFLRARVFLERCRDAASGGFFFSPVVLAANKAGDDERGRPVPYGSATADGLLALLAAGAEPADPAATAARDWLAARFRADVCPGPSPHAIPRWDDALRGYWRAAAARALAATGHLRPGDARARALSRSIVAEAAPDGSHRNPNPNMKEDDPLIATAFAVDALARACCERPAVE